MHYEAHGELNSAEYATVISIALNNEVTSATQPNHEGSRDTPIVPWFMY